MIIDSIDEARAHLADIRRMCRVAHLCDLRDGEALDFHISDPEIGSLVYVTISRCDPADDRMIEYRSMDLPLADIGRHPLLQSIGPVGFVAAMAVVLLSGWRRYHAGGYQVRDLLGAANFVLGQS